MPASLLRRWALSAECLIAADSGADRLLEAGVEPHAVIGDMDSIADVTRWGEIPFICLEDQDSTDCDKVLKWIAGQGHRQATVTGLEGDLLDHLLASVSSLVRSKLQLRVALRRGVAWVLRDGESLAVQAEPGSRVSLIPIQPCEPVHLTGVRWPVEGVGMVPGAFLSVSNVATEDEVRASIGSGAALLFVETPAGGVPCW